MPHTIASAAIDLDQANLAWAAIIEAKRIGIISHRHPDPDTIGSNLTLYDLLSSMGKSVHSYCVDQIPQTYQFLPQTSGYLSELIPAEHDLLISVDCGSPEQMAFQKTHPTILERNFINIDHHASNQSFGIINIVQTNLSSTSEIIFNLLNYWGVSITPRMATYLLVGLYYDTGSFMHSNATPAVMEMAESLLRLGANQQLIIQNLYHNFSQEKFHLWGKTLEKIKITDKNSAVAVFGNDELQEFHNASENLSGVIDFISMTKEIDFAVMISEEKTGQIKGSLRTRYDHINLSDLAGQLGGGGHRKASGFGFPGKLTKEVSWKIIPNPS